MPCWIQPASLCIFSSESHLLWARMRVEPQGAQAVLLPAKTGTSPLLLYFFREILAVWYYSIFYFRRTST